MPSQIAHALFWACAAVCAVGQGALLWTAVRRQERGARTSELAWAVLPAPGLALLLAATWAALP